MVGHEERLQALREERGMSQLELAEQLGVSRQTVSRWEAGQIKPSADNLLRLSQLWGVPVDALLKDGWAEEKAPEIQVVEVPVEVPVSRPICRPLIALLAALILIAGIVIGALFFRERRPEAVPSSEMEWRVLDPSEIGEYMPLLPPWEEEETVSSPGERSEDALQTDEMESDVIGDISSIRRIPILPITSEDEEEVIPESELEVKEIDPSTVIYGNLLPPLPGSSEPN